MWSMQDEDETQAHILKCKSILQMQKEDDSNIPPYDKIIDQ